MKYKVGELVLCHNPGTGFTLAADKIDEGYQVCRVMKAIDGEHGHFVAVRVLNETTGVEALNPSYPKLTREEAVTLLLGDP